MWAWYPEMIPASSIRRTRSATAGEVSPTRWPSSVNEIRAFSCSSNPYRLRPGGCMSNHRTTSWLLLLAGLLLILGGCFTPPIIGPIQLAPENLIQNPSADAGTQHWSFHTATTEIFLTISSTRRQISSPNSMKSARPHGTSCDRFSSE